MTAAVIVPVVDEGLGNSAYLVDLGEGRALAVDVPRDLRAVRELAGLGFRAQRLVEGFPEWKRAGLPVAVPAGAGGS